MQILSHGCTLDCWDMCKFNVHVENGQVLKIEGDPNHPFTKGFICPKGKKHLDRLLHKERIYKPRKKVNGNWLDIDFDEAVELVSQKLKYYKDNYGSASVMHFFQSGSGGISKNIENIFFNYYGGITLAKGSLCWGAGIQAQKYDFGEARGHFIQDTLKAKSIFLWGRNPANTSVHLTQIVKEAKAHGVKIIVIDPLFSDTAALADLYIRINPATDAALAMAMTKIIINEGMTDEDFIKNNIHGFEEYKTYLDSLDISWLANQAGVDLEVIKELALLYTGQKPAALYIGYGLQKYQNGGNTVRAIDALGAISGNVGKPGGGVNYANRIYPDLLQTDPFNSSKYAVNNRYFNAAEMADFITYENDPPIKALFVSKANPMAQMPNLSQLSSALDKVEFKVCIDMFMTDTAECCDLFIPCSNTLETEDIVYSSMGNPYIIYNEKTVEPRNELMDEFYFFRRLAKEMGMEIYPTIDKTEYLAKVTAPLAEHGIDLSKIKKGYITLQESPVAWHDFQFKTPSGKIEIYSERAKKDGQSPMAVYVESPTKGKIRLITSHPRKSLFSQHFLDIEGVAKAYMSPKLAEKYHVENGGRAVIKSSRGEITVQVELSPNIPDNVVHMYTGWWKKHGNPNYLTENLFSDMGGQVAYYETFIEIKN